MKITIVTYRCAHIEGTQDVWFEFYHTTAQLCALKHNIALPREYSIHTGLPSSYNVLNMRANYALFIDVALVCSLKCLHVIVIQPAALYSKEHCDGTFRSNANYVYISENFHTMRIILDSFSCHSRNSLCEHIQISTNNKDEVLGMKLKEILIRILCRLRKTVNLKKSIEFYDREEKFFSFDTQLSKTFYNSLIKRERGIFLILLFLIRFIYFFNFYIFSFPLRFLKKNFLWTFLKSI